MMVAGQDLQLTLHLLYQCQVIEQGCMLSLQLHFVVVVVVVVLDKNIVLVVIQLFPLNISNYLYSYIFFTAYLIISTVLV